MQRRSDIWEASSALFLWLPFIWVMMIDKSNNRPISRVACSQIMTFPLNAPPSCTIKIGGKLSLLSLSPSLSWFQATRFYQKFELRLTCFCFFSVLFFLFVTFRLNLFRHLEQYRWINAWDRAPWKDAIGKNEGEGWNVFWIPHYRSRRITKENPLFFARLCRLAN